MKSIRGGAGLGDALYVQSVARHLVRRGEMLQVCTKWPDAFRPLGDAVATAPFRRNNIDYLAHYSLRKRFPDTKQFEDCCIQAGVHGPVELKLDWRETSAIGRQIKDAGRPILCVQMPRAPMGRLDGFGKELLPDFCVIQRMIDAVKDRALILQIGSGAPLFKFSGIDVDLANKTTVCELLDVAAVADGFIGYCSFIVPLAESLDKPALLVWSDKGLKSGNPYVRQITPEKVLFKPSSRHVVDMWPQAKIDEALHDLLRSRHGAPHD